MIADYENMKNFHKFGAQDCVFKSRVLLDFL